MEKANTGRRKMEDEEGGELWSLCKINKKIINKNEINLRKSKHTALHKECMKYFPVGSKLLSNSRLKNWANPSLFADVLSFFSSVCLPCSFIAPLLSNFWVNFDSLSLLPAPSPLSLTPHLDIHVTQTICKHQSSLNTKHWPFQH